MSVGFANFPDDRAEAERWIVFNGEAIIELTIGKSSAEPSRSNMLLDQVIYALDLESMFKEYPYVPTREAKGRSVGVRVDNNTLRTILNYQWKGSTSDVSDFMRVVLVPNEEPECRLFYKVADVRVSDDEAIEIRVGSFCLAMQQPFGPPSEPQSTATAKCQSGRTACRGGAEICCDNGETLGKCYGGWSCR